VLSVPRLYTLSSCYFGSLETAVRRGEAGEMAASQQRIVHSWEILPSSAVKTVTENISPCVIMICEV
jgi:hypothetical protein